jgi:hypothetical protein
MVDSRTEYHLRILDSDDTELLHSRSESPFMVPRVGEFIHVSDRKRVVTTIVHSLVLDSADNLVHDCVARVKSAK